jgi:hypothetical protein
MQRESRGRQLLGAIEVQSLKVGGVQMLAEQADAITDLDELTGGQSPTEEEHNLVVSAVNDILAALRAAGIVAAE